LMPDHSLFHCYSLEQLPEKQHHELWQPCQGAADKAACSFYYLWFLVSLIFSFLWFEPGNRHTLRCRKLLKAGRLCMVKPHCTSNTLTVCVSCNFCSATQTPGSYIALCPTCCLHAI
jgi:hypothetical protein